MTRPQDWPEIPSIAWRRPMGLPCPEAGHPRVDLPMIDDGTYAGVPLGGLGTGSIGRTHRGDFARWHLEVGKHAFAPVAADGFSIFVGRPGGGGTATVLSTLRPDALPAWGWTLPEGAGTYHALFPRAWQAFEPEVLGVRLARMVGLRSVRHLAGRLIPGFAIAWNAFGNERRTRLLADKAIRFYGGG